MSTLSDHGIWQDESILRIHVSPGFGVFAFKTQRFKKWLKENDWNFTLRKVTIDGSTTAEGYCIPYKRIPGVQIITPNSSENWKHWGFSPDDDTSAKGKKAATLAQALINREMIKGIEGPVSFVPDTEVELQLKGLDLLAEDGSGVEVKYDGPVKKTRNLFIQVRECNSGKSY